MDDCSLPSSQKVLPPKTNESPCIASMEKALRPIGNGGPKVSKKRQVNLKPIFTKANQNILLMVPGCH